MLTWPTGRYAPGLYKGLPPPPPGKDHIWLQTKKSKHQVEKGFLYLPTNRIGFSLLFELEVV